MLHDLYLEAVSDVASKFAQRQRKDGHYYVFDFSLDEIRSLRVNERRETSGDAAFPARFPIECNIFRIPTLEELAQLIQGMNRSTGRNVGLYIEPKSPHWHKQQGQDILAQTLAALDRLGYRSKNDRVYLQSFCADSLKRARFEFKSDLQMVQLIGENDWGESSTDFDLLRTVAGLEEVSTYAQGIGPWLLQVVNLETLPARLQPTPLIERAHQSGLFVHAYTLRSDQLPAEMNDFELILDFLTRHSELDGVFTDFPDRVISFMSGKQCVGNINEAQLVQ